MGAYLSEPVTAKHSSEDSSDTLVVGASSMQGWRVNQEDAHNTLLSFDKGIQLFAVYDGHGGAEVATYCSQKLPDFIRLCDAYSKGDLEEALKQAFLELDASLTKEEVIAELRKLAFPNESDAEDEDDNVANLREEASMPLEDVMAKYQSSAGAPAFKKLQAAIGKSPMSPCIRRGAAGSGCTSSTDSTGPSSSGAGPSASGAGSSSSTAEAENAGCGSSSSPSKATGSPSKATGSPSKATGSPSKATGSPSKATGSPSKATGSPSKATGSPSKTTGSSSTMAVSSSEEDKVCASVSESPSKQVKEESEENKVTQTDSSDTKVPQPENKCKETSNGPSEDKNSKPQVNGDVPHSKEESAETADAVSSTTETSLKNGKLSEDDEVKTKGKGKAKDKTKSISKDDEVEKEEKKSGRTRTTPVRKLSSMHVMKYLASAGELSDSEESEDDEDDTSFEGKMESSEEEDDEEGEEEEDEDDEDDMEDTDSEDDEDMMRMGEFNEEPGSDSGCTAVVALLRGRDLFVANAGDSRCVVCRDGKAIDMSLDHKPEDAPEMARIKAAGGKVTCDGRVNGGLNLSRAIGDHAYKQSKDIPPTDQMITALPDVRTLRIDPKQDEFMILACDGIWNFMSSQNVVEFVRERLEKKLKPAKICEELFDHCLSPDTMGDGTGCDNMTAVIVQFQPSLEKEPSTLVRETILESPITNEIFKRRDVEDVEMEKDKEEEEDCDEDEKKEDDESEEKNEKGAKKRFIESNDAEEVESPKQKKVKVDSEANEANGVEV